MAYDAASPGKSAARTRPSHAWLRLYLILQNVSDPIIVFTREVTTRTAPLYPADVVEMSVLGFHSVSEGKVRGASCD